MLDEIKIRSKIEENYLFKGYCNDGGYTKFSLFGLNPPMSKNKFLAIVQYSQMNDTNNCLIFNGDIFEWGKNSRGIVTIKKGRWIIENLNGDFPLFEYCKDGKVIGNTIGNKELLIHEDLVR